MPLIHFTNPVEIPAYRDSGLEVLPAEFTLRPADVVDVLDRYLERHRRYHSAIPKQWPRYKEAARVRELRELLTEATDMDRAIAAEDGPLIWALCIDLMFDLRFEAVRCPTCSAAYGRTECRVGTWVNAGSGGRSVLCPNGHVLYTISEWHD